MSKKIAVTIGDIHGIGIEILIKIFQTKREQNFVLFTNYKIIKNFLNKKNIKIKLNICNNNHYKEKYLNIYTYSAHSNEENTLKSIRYSYLETKKNNFIGLITLPLRKDLIIKKVLKNFSGHTEYLQKMDGKKFSNMILYHKNIIVSPLTTHIPVKSISKQISKKDFIYNRLKSLYNTLKKDLAISNPKIIISGLNPHAGENGNIGIEELNIIIPVINRLKKQKLNIDGPFSSDSMINDKNLQNYNCFVFLFHDQALIPFKYISKFSGVNFTGNLDIIRTSPDHGTAYNLVGSNKISDKSLLNCFNLIKKIIINNKKYEKTKKIFKSKLH